jgi:rfaE bifunctional protein nucleotidyltransferase chain/domain
MNPDVRPSPESLAGKFLADLSLLERRVHELKSSGRRVVFTNGGFDLLHVGHLRSLRGARSLGDHLIVAVNSDRAVRAQKGRGRPIFPQEERVELLSALECVDTVFVFDEPTADRLLDRLRPHVHAKGTDYAAGAPEEATVRAYGGEVAIVGDPKAHSTSELIARIRAAGGLGEGPER